MKKLFVYVDGTARGNPGQAAVGIAIADRRGEFIDETAYVIGRTTPEVAEYRALIEAARYVAKYSPAAVVFFTDNQQLANYINGVFDARKPNLRQLLERARDLLNQYPSWRVNYVDPVALRRAPLLVEQAFHHRIQAQLTRDRLELELLAVMAELDERGVRRVIDFANSLRGV